MRRTYNHHTHQQGVALIVVLIFLILIALAGAMAIRQSHTDLKTATADQINTLLLQSSDSANQRLEAILATPPSTASSSTGTTTSSTARTTNPYDDALGTSGMFGYFVLDRANDHLGDEYIYCYNPRGTKYLINNATVRKAGGGFLNPDVGICDYNDADDYTSDRKTVITQVNMVSVSPKSSTPKLDSAVALSSLPIDDTKMFETVPIGRNTSDNKLTTVLLDIRTTSLLPAYSEPVGNNGTCLKEDSKPNSNGEIPMLSCLHAANTPTKMLYEHATVSPVTTTKKCFEEGASATLNRDCL